MAVRRKVFRIEQTAGAVARSAAHQGVVAIAKPLPVADLDALLVIQHRTVDGARDMVFGEFARRAHIDHGIKLRQLIQRAVDVAMRGAGGVVRLGIGWHGGWHGGWHDG